MIQLTIVAFYGKKQEDFAKLIKQCQDLISNEFPKFKPYELEQVHATLISLKRKDGSKCENEMFSKHRISGVDMNLSGYLEFLQRSSFFPLEVQIGGFGKREYPFRSRNVMPYERSFSIQGKIAVLMGWPICDEPSIVPPMSPEEYAIESRLYPMSLHIIRHAAQSYGILHDYHEKITSTDNDLYFRIGLFEESLGIDHTERIESARRYLSELSPLILQLKIDDITIVAYDNTTLPYDPLHTRYWKITDDKITEEFLLSLYS
jgi:hypothetical protein